MTEVPIGACTYDRRRAVRRSWARAYRAAALGEPIPERLPGVYAVEAAGTVVYVGRTRRSIRKRLAEFCRHRHGARASHRGGQAVLLMTEPRLIYWAATPDPVGAERRLLDEHIARTGEHPIANKRGEGKARPPRHPLQ